MNLKVNLRRIRIRVRYLSITAFLVAFAALLPGVGGSISSGDTGELALAGQTLGIPHSPGYPVFALIHYAASRFLLFGNVAYQQNVVACLLLALSMAAFGILCALITSRRETIFAPLLLLAAPDFRHLAWITEVFPLAILWSALIYLTLIRWHRRRTGIYLISFLMGIGVSIHQTLILMVPALLAYLVWGRPRARKELTRDILPILGFFALGLSVFLYLPFRSVADPLLDWEDPETLGRFWGVVTRERYGFLQLAQGAGGFGFSWRAFWNAVLHTRDVFIQNIGWIGVGLMFLGSLASLARRAHRRWMAVTWIHVLFTGPVFFWLAKVDPRTAGGLMERFAALPLAGAIVLIAIASATLLASGLPLYRGFLAVVLVVFIGERALAHPFPRHAGPPVGFAAMKEGGALRWDLSTREAGINALKMTPRQGLLFADRADETEFALGYLLLAERRRSDVMFVDCNAGVTRSIYGDDYYRIWGKPRLARRETVEREMIGLKKRPVVYATLDPTMIDIYRTHRGLLYRAWPLNQVEDPSPFPWAAISAWRYVPSDVRSRLLFRANLDLLGRSSFERGHLDWAERCFGLSQLAGGPHRYEALGYWHQTRGDLPAARGAYQKAMNLGIVSEALFINRGALELEAGRVDEARVLYEEGLRRYPNSLMLTYNLALAHWRGGRRLESEALVNKVLARDPKNVEAQRLLRQLKENEPVY